MDIDGGHNDYILIKEKRERKRKESQITFKKIFNRIKSFYYSYEVIFDVIFYLFLLSLGFAIIGFIIDGNLNIFNLPSKYQIKSSFNPVPKPNFYGIKKLIHILSQIFGVLSGLLIIIITVVKSNKKYNYIP